mmetsp:Transcript_13565/g.27324  ORF Transcript_13565/g.27324 Transcript_13565/m.27324 type:complete len:512 (+) Transcript_13565:61-1596(+)
MGKSTRNHDQAGEKMPAEESEKGSEPTIQEVESPDLYSSITVTQNPFGESVWDVYEKVQLIEDGGTGELWKARKSSNDDSGVGKESQEFYAIKCIDKNFLFGMFTKELRNEIENLRHIDHPNVVRIYETFETRDSMFLVMEYCSGGDLFARLPYSEPKSAWILTQILSAVAHCHKQKIIHRDLKCENVLWENEGEDASIKVIDFGYAQHYRRPRGDYTMKIDIGTTYTMSPQVLEGEYTEKCDLWSVGVIAYILLSGGSRPFDAENDKEIRCKIKEGRYSMEGSMWDDVSEEAKNFVASLLRYDPYERVSAEEALQSHWLQKSCSLEENEPEKQILNEIQDALAHSVEEPKLKRLSMMIIAHCAPAKKLQELRQAFNTLDHSNDGTINFAEFKDAMRDCDFSAEQVNEIFYELDQNKTGLIHYTDFLAATLETRGKIDEELVEEAFERLDVENTGTISKDGLSSILEQSRTSNDCEKVAEELIKEAGEGMDEELKYETFSCMFESNSETFD